MKFKVELPILAVPLYDDNELLTEILFKNPVIEIDYYLNRRINYDIKME